MRTDDDMPGHPEGGRRSHGLRWLMADVLAVLLTVLVLAWPADGRPAASASALPAELASEGFLPLFRAPFQWETTPPTPTLPPTDTPMPPTPTPRPTDTPAPPPPTATFTPAPSPTYTPAPTATATRTRMPTSTATPTRTPTYSPTPTLAPTTPPPAETPIPTSSATWTPAPSAPTQTPMPALHTPTSTPAAPARDAHLEGYLLLAVAALGAGVAIVLWLLARRRH